MRSLERSRKALDNLNTVAVGLSIDSVSCKFAWTGSLKIKKARRLASFWSHEALAKSWGILRTEGFSENANILLDEAGKVLFVKICPIRKLPDIKEILTALMV